jgi:uncharacterized SAM-binding protein YcdF (DUF218 family)
MYFVLSKLVGFVLTPSNVIAAFCIVGFILLGLRIRRAGGVVLTIGIVSLALVGWTPLANWITLPLTERFPVWRDDGRPPDGIIILGGAIKPEVSEARGMVAVNANADRIIAMLDLARRYPRARLVFSGGSGSLLGKAVSEAPIAGKLLDDFGLSNGRVILETTSRTTEENAVRTREVVSPRPGERWLLVTSSFHMPRAVGIYRKAGFDVEAYPVDFLTTGWNDAGRPFRRLSWGLERADAIAHEWIGLVAARLNGNSDELFPGPRAARQ